MAERTLHPHPDVILTELSDGTGVLLHLQTKFFFTLNESGVVVWKALSAGATRGALWAALVRDFDIDPPTAERDVQILLDELASQRLVIEED